jgi:tetratricopeptide (TPR) repeat protein
MLCVASWAGRGTAAGRQSPAGGQPAGAAAQPPAAPAAAGMVAADKAIQEAAALARAGKFAAAAQRLEAARRQLTLPPRGLSLLATLYTELHRPKEALAILQPLAAAEDAEPAVLYNAGMAALADGQRDLAQGYFTRSVAKNPATPAARELGLLLARQGRIVEAYALLRPWSVRNAEDGEALLTAAALALQLERPGEAEQLISGMAREDPAIQLMHAKILVQKGDGASAVTLLTPLLARHPSGMELEVRRTLAEAYLAAGQAPKAVELLKGRAAGHPSTTLLLARAQHQAGDALAALATLRPLADKLPADGKGLGDPRPAAGIALEYGRALADAGRAPEAIAYFEKATRIEPGRREAWQDLSRALAAANRAGEAQKAAAKAAELQRAAVAPAPADPQVLSQNMQEAMRLMVKGQTEPALAAVRRELAASPGNLQARTLEVRLLMSLSRFPAALAAAEAELALAPENPDFIYQRGAVEISTGDRTGAERDLRRALQLAPDHVPAMNDLAVLLVMQGNKAEAQKLLERVLRLQPGDPNATASLEALKKGE